MINPGAATIINRTKTSGTIKVYRQIGDDANNKEQKFTGHNKIAGELLNPSLKNC
ncbi:MAG: hypothetical protein ACLFN5_03695 [bacterium]